MYSTKRHIDLMLAQVEIFCSIIQMNTGLCCYLTRWLTPETLKNGAMAGAVFKASLSGTPVRRIRKRRQGSRGCKKQPQAGSYSKFLYEEH